MNDSMRGMGAGLYAFADRYLYWINVPKLENITAIDVIEVIILAVVIYGILAWFKNTRAWALGRGILVILLVIVVAAIFRMHVILWLASNLASIAVIALIIIFQPELRTALENLGRRTFFARLFRGDPNRAADGAMSEKSINEIVRACVEMGKQKTGALIVVEGNERLREYIRTGIELDSMISSQLLLNIFEHNTPLHDGAVIVRGDRIVAATCYLPLSDNRELSKEYGTRHRAALGMSEASDALTIVVSEETGALSVAIDRTLYSDVDAEFLRTKLREAAQLDGSDSFRQRRRKREKNRSEADAETESPVDETERGSRDA